ncbi:MAG: beta-N-acetylhexosaminidase [Bacteroidetes bacterium]|nr:beta-N-acetylhexosaminidase [Bacteroidota bacterium]MDA1122208.1 beta-N-acetylhexosaminidase [Bacteroidota bacterium]
MGQYLAGRLVPATGFGIETKTSASAPSGGNIYLKLTNDVDLGDEGYLLEITEDLIVISANKATGLFYGSQTIRQLLPASIESSSVQQGPWEIATGTIQDSPKFQHRGVMLDVARHFFTVNEVKRYIDFLAYYKMNSLHLGLSNDQGWRIEIKSWPNLATYGGSTEVGGGAGGFYTQEQYTDIVNYAAERFINIIPEIDVPGHTNAALASYAELNCDGKATDLYTGTEVGFSTLCTNKEMTYKFIDDVVRKLAALTPGPYLHMGGDETHATAKEDFLPFVERVQAIVKSHGKTMIGWEEMSQSTLIPGTIIQFWKNAEYAQNAVSQGGKVIMSPAPKVYIDMQYDSTSRLGLHWAAYIEVDDSYDWDPETYAEGIGKEDIIGVEAALWSETLETMDDIEWMTFPRLPGIAEAGWSPSKLRNWDEYKVRLANHEAFFKIMGIDFYRSKTVPWVDKP